MLTKMAKYSNYSALNDMIKAFNLELIEFNSDLIVSFSLLLYVIFANSSRSAVSRFLVIYGTQFEKHPSRL